MPEEVMIRAEGLGKKYVIGHQRSNERYVALRDVLAQKVRNVGRSLRDLMHGQATVAGDELEEFWALQDMNFEIRRGDVVGIIGRNGAGKSTLLKILSRITEPSAGRVTIHGRVASLLEVGTGFHPELTGRENIYLNGAVLGMKRTEVKRKFDEIVAFAGVERFLDTPVKRFSSGMYVRLAFAIAAHLEPEILIVDEVLAVGDVEFQDKCLGKMQDVSRGGRTVLFVSHNMAAVKSLTSRGLTLDGGRVTFDGATNLAIARYLENKTARREATESKAPSGQGAHTRIRSVGLLNDAGEWTTNYKAGSLFRIELEFETDGTKGLSLELMLLDHMGAKLGLCSLHHFQDRTLPEAPGIYRCTLALEPLHLAAGSYSIDATTSIVNHEWDHYVSGAVAFDVDFSNPAGGSWNFLQSYGYGSVAMPFISSVTFVAQESVCRPEPSV